MRKGQPKELMNWEMLDEAVAVILEGMVKTGDGLKSEMNSRFEKVDKNIRKLYVELSDIKNIVNCLKDELSNTLSRRELISTIPIS